MGQLYEKMKADLKLRRYSLRTQKSYLWSACRFVRHCAKPPTEMGKDDIRRFLLMLHDRGESASSIKMYVASLRFLYAVTLERPSEVEHIPWPRVAQKLPAVISRADVEALLGKIDPLVCRMVVMTPPTVPACASPRSWRWKPVTSTARLESSTSATARATGRAW